MYAFRDIVKNFTAVSRFAVAADVMAQLDTIQGRVTSGAITKEAPLS